MLDLHLVRLVQLDREREIQRTLRANAVRKAIAECARETFVPPSPESRPALHVRSGIRGRLVPTRGF